MTDTIKVALCDAADVSWSAVQGPVEITDAIVYEDGPQPRDAKGRFRKRAVFHFDPKTETYTRVQ